MTVLEERPRTARRAMIDSQLRVSGVNEPAVLAAFEAVAREDFVPEGLKDSAYIDRALPLAGGQALAAPLVHGRMLGEAAPVAGERVLVVSASGYLGALVATFGSTVTTITPSEAATAKKGAAADLILIDGAIEQLPASLAARLAEGGRVVTGLVERGVTRLAAGTRIGGQIALAPLADIGMPVLAEFAAPRSWSF